MRDSLRAEGKEGLKMMHFRTRTFHRNASSQILGKNELKVVLNATSCKFLPVENSKSWNKILLTEIFGR